ncbi:hypothetical protein K491DRAFT_772584 [Lophiostoma macrostomum CBS 122681]|uniref:Homing endonuclease LAGLIDADG domain-containing protein n=1 Tax=Lophiostoma macrostomum CBS 122681 TaxID=1314788 RepID=A0A6A6SH96_9PLEO|nr:hypothetical protein K491DRAFT_772584 [Lophiostoma macrostomum CBS 122681]
MGLIYSCSITNSSATDYMLGTILYVYCLLFINTFYLYKLDVSKKILLLNSENNDTTSSNELPSIQSAENCKGFSETVRIIDGDGIFDIRTYPTSKKRVLKQIRIKLHNRDIRILTHKNKPYSIYIISTKEDMTLKVLGFKESCNLCNIEYIEANYNIGLYDPYFSGLIDTDGSIVFNYAGNRIELNFDNTILHSKPYIVKREKSSKFGGSKDFRSIAFKFQNVNNMLFIYDYFMQTRLFCDVKFYRVMKIKSFIEIRKYKTSPKHSLEHKIYSNFVID